MKAPFSSLWQPDGTLRRDPSTTELSGGIPCGPFDRTLYNELYYRDSQVYQELGNLITAAGLTPDDATLTQVLQAVQRRSGLQVLSTVGSGNFVVPANVYRIYYEVWGGGGGGGGSQASDASTVSVANGGEGGSHAEGYLDVTPGQSIAYTVGARGAAGAPNAAGGTGGSSIFGGITALGGAGGGVGNTPTTPPVVQQFPPSGRTATGGLINYTTTSGYPSIVGGGTGNVASGNGGPGYGGSAGGRGSISTGAAGQSTTTPAAGGGGAGSGGGTSALAGGQGGPGIIILRW